MAWATITDLVTLYEPASQHPDEWLQFQLDSTEDLISSLLDEGGVDYSDPSDAYLRKLHDVTLRATIRMLASGDVLPGITSWSQTAGPITQSFKSDEGIGSLYLTGNELAMLGVSKSGRGTQLMLSEDVLGGGGDAQ